MGIEIERCSKLIRELDQVGCCGNISLRVRFNPNEGFSRTHRLSGGLEHRWWLPKD